MSLPAYIQTLPAYVPGESVESLAARLERTPESIIKLDANENTYGTPPAVRRALAALDYTHRYPDAEQRDLRTALSSYTSVPADFLLAGNGSDELLSLMSQVLLEPGDSVIVSPPTFSMYAFYARLKNCNIVEVPRKADFSLDVDGIISTAQASSAKIIFIDAPGNPTGIGLPSAWFEKLLAFPVLGEAEEPALIVLDEAYIEFSDMPSRITDVPKHDNLVVLRTFSKWAGLAGFRIGYGAFPKWLGDALWKAKSPYNVTTPAMTAALAALSDLETLKANISRIIADRERLVAELRNIPGLTVFPSETNFLLVRVEPEFGKTATEVCNMLKEQGILIRLFEKMNSLRITIGKPEEMTSLLEAFSRLAV
jgi:histidinol-phosphate aminotransferase